MAEKEYIEREAIKSKKIYSEERHEYVVPVAEIDWMISADVAPVRHGHWVKEKSDVLTDTDKWIEQISNMVFDVNPPEITFQAQESNLTEWCLRWQQEMNMLIITAPLDYSNAKESEENA